ncbi:hypothetical protein K8I61_01185 [bacterium]|nr:hypothetical protein [bacterium]
MKRTFVLLAVAALAFSACAVKTEKLRVDTFEDIRAMSEAEAADESGPLMERVTSIWTTLEDQKLTAYITKKKIAPYFEDETALTEFIAIYASLMRQSDFDREVVRKYRVNNVKIEPNGVVAHVDIDIWGRIYFVWYAKIHEIQEWRKSGGVWYLMPVAY